jgi:Na+/melibiose symporter-like transporter
MFGSVSFFPLFVQSVLGTSATQAGITITPMLLGWVTASIIGMRLLMRVGYRILGLAGTTILVAGTFLMTTIGAGSSQALMMVYVALMGVGMGLSIPSFLVAIQTSVDRRYLGTATSTLQFSRSIGGTLGVSVMRRSPEPATGRKPERCRPRPAWWHVCLTAPGGDSRPQAGASLAWARRMHIVL